MQKPHAHAAAQRSVSSGSEGVGPSRWLQKSEKEKPHFGETGPRGRCQAQPFFEGAEFKEVGRCRLQAGDPRLLASSHAARDGWLVAWGFCG